MLDEDFKEEYDKLRPRYAMISRIIEESGNYNPILDFLAYLVEDNEADLKMNLVFVVGESLRFYIYFSI